jgi:serine phosphatase RsbU (regulator of sigma subunit)
MKSFIIKYKPVLINVLTITLLLVSLINFYFLFEVVPQSNDECLWINKNEKDDGKIYFDLVKFEGVTWEAGIRDNDILKEINGIKTSSLYKASVILNSLKAGEYAEYKVERSGYEFTTKVYVKKLINFAGLGLALLSFFWILAGHIVITARPDGRIQKQFYLVGVFFGLVALHNLTVGTIGQNPLFEYPWILILVDNFFILGAVFLPFLLVHFFWSFPKEFDFVKKRSVKLAMQIIPVIIFIVTIVLKYIYSYGRVSDNYQIMKYHGGFTILLGVGLLAGLISLFINYLKLSNNKERNSIFVILISYAIGVGAIIYTSFFASILAESVFNDPEYYLPIIFVAMLPISFGYSIFKYSLMDVSDVVKNTIIYGAATISIAAVYFFLIYFIGQSVSSAFSSEYQGAVAGIVFILFAFVFQSTKNKFQDIITEKFYPEQFAYQKVLIEFNNEISTVVGSDNILDKIQDTFIKSLKINKFGIILKNGEANKYHLFRVHGIDSNLRISFSEERLLKHISAKQDIRQPISVCSHQFEEIFPDFKDALEKEKIYTVIPLTIKNTIIGMILFGLKYSGAQFSGKDLDLLCAAANQTAISVENARLYESEAKKIKLEIDLENASRIQQNLLPQDIPEIAGLDLAGTMIPAMHIGGDYFDIVKLSDSKILIVIGDVSGKGFSASFYMSKLQTMVRFYSKSLESPKSILEEINKGIFGEIDRNTFITASVALVDMESKVMKYCRAGHTELLYANGNNEVKVIVPKGIGLGLEKGDIFDSMLEERTIELFDNSIFLFFSDGISEAMNKRDEFFGTEKLIQVFAESRKNSSKQIIAALINSVSEFRGNCEQNDDITAVVMKYKSI